MQRDKQASLKGIFNITVTPFAADGAIDYPALASSIERVVGLDYDGLLIGGTYGEFPTMSPQERAELFRRSIEYAAGKVPVMLCTAASEPRITLELTQLASALGAYAMVTAPYVSEVQEQHILEYFRWIAPVARSGLIVYNAPGIGIALSASLIEHLSTIDNVVGLKQGDLDPTAIDQIANRLSGKLKLFCASDLAFLGPIMAGFDGLSSTNSCAFPELILATYRAVRSGDIRSATDLHRSWYTFRELARRYGQPQTVKAAMAHRGWGKRSRPIAVATAHASATKRGRRSDRRHPRVRSRFAQSGGVIVSPSFHSNVARILLMVESSIAEILKQIPQGAECAFEKPEYGRRTTALRQEMARKGFDLLLTSGPENIYYLTGQQTPGYYMFQCLGIPAAGEPFLVLRGLESMNARLKSSITDIEGYADDTHPAVALAAALKKRGWVGKRIAIDRNSWFLTVNLFDKVVEECGALLDGSLLIEPLRRVKSSAELEQIEKAAVANDAGMQAGLDATRVGVSENDIAAEIMAGAIRAGSEYVGMEPFVTSGARGGIPHTTWRRRTIAGGDVIALETCACYNRYHAALFRTVAAGTIPKLADDMYKVCLEGLDAAIEKLRPGNTCADVHNAAQAVIDRHGYTAGYRKRTGYSIGISFAPDWGEGNILSLFRGVDVPLAPGMTFHVPITLREYNKFTVAVSETVVVTNGAARTLSKISRELLRV